MKPYSIDLRQKIVDTYSNGEGSIRTIAKRFRVSTDCVRRLVKQHRMSGTIAPKAHGGGPQAKLTTAELEILQTLVAEDNDATLEQLAQRLAEKIQVVVSSSTISRAISKLNLTRKKKVSKQRQPTKVSIKTSE
jgi:transposase